ncbi:MAG: MFS transporter [Candidatus Dormibacteraceae bacterium]
MGRGLWRSREFLKFWGGQSLSLFGSQFTLLALPIVAVVTLHATAADMGVLTALFYVAALLFGLVAGLLLDRVRRRPVMIVSQLVSAVALVTIPATDLLRALSLPQLFVVSFITGAAATFTTAGQTSLLPALVDREELVDANAKYQTTSTLASLFGPGLAGVAIQALTAPIVIVFDAASFLVGAASLALLGQVGAIDTATSILTPPTGDRRRGRPAPPTG